MKFQAEILEAVSILLMGFAAGMSAGERNTNAYEISLGAMIIAVLCIALGASARNKYTPIAMAERIDALRYRGLYPPQGQGSDEDVKRLKAAGENGLALQLYLELHAVPLKEAHRAFKAL
ncbi:MAG TPA: hypothetical protein VF627_02980 [Abditibacterium sp.]|jgi:hypothetical protein